MLCGHMGNILPKVLANNFSIQPWILSAEVTYEVLMVIFFPHRFLLHLLYSVLPSGLEDLSPLLHLFIIYMWYEYAYNVYEYVILWARILIVYIVITYTVNIQLSLEQHRFEMNGSVYTQTLTNKYSTSIFIFQIFKLIKCREKFVFD